MATAVIMIPQSIVWSYRPSVYLGLNRIGSIPSVHSRECFSDMLSCPFQVGDRLTAHRSPQADVSLLAFSTLLPSAETSVSLVTSLRRRGGPSGGSCALAEAWGAVHLV